MFPASFNLNSLNGKNGFLLYDNTNINSGSSVSGAGDFNHDGLSDIVVSAPSMGSQAMQKVSIVFGRSTTFLTQPSLTNLNGENGFIIVGLRRPPFSHSSWSTTLPVSGIGDFNGDGIDDVIIGNPLYINCNSWNDLCDGQSYIIFGSETSFPPSFNVTSLNGQNGFTIGGIINASIGRSVSSAGDVNGDEIDDVIIGGSQGEAYVIFGRKGLFPMHFNLSDLNGENGFIVDGDSCIDSVSKAGDINGDGIDDVILSCWFALNNGGQSYVVFGSKNTFPTQLILKDLNGKNGFTINGISPGYLGEESGYSIGSAGDFNGDGIDDVIIGAPAISNVESAIGGAGYILFGSKHGFPAQINLAALNGQNGFALNSNKASGSGAGYSVSGIGDINGDKLDDVIIGTGLSPQGDGSTTQSYVVLGSNITLPAQFNLAGLNGTNGFVVNGLPNGYSVSGVGDVNGDGKPDFVTSYPFGSCPVYEGTEEFGSTYVILDAAISENPLPPLLSPCIPTPSTPPSSDGYDTGTIVGIVLGSLAGVCCLSCAYLYARFANRPMQHPQKGHWETKPGYWVETGWAIGNEMVRKWVEPKEVWVSDGFLRGSWVHEGGFLGLGGEWIWHADA